MVITKRALNKKRHTIGYLVGGQWRTRAEAVNLARQGRVDNVRVRLGGNDEKHLVGTNGIRLEEVTSIVEPEAYVDKFGI